MKYEKWIADWKTAIAENFFLRVLILMLAGGIIANGVFFKKNERIILVPLGLDTKVWVERTRMSPEFLESMAVNFALLAGNLAPNNARYNVKQLLDYINPDRRGDVKTELMGQALYIEKTSLQQSFFPSSVKVERNSEAVVEGKIIRYVGSKKISSERALFRMKFVVKNYRLYLDDIFIDYPDRKSRKEKESET